MSKNAGYAAAAVGLSLLIPGVGPAVLAGAKGLGGAAAAGGKTLLGIGGAGKAAGGAAAGASGGGWFASALPYLAGASALGTGYMQVQQGEAQKDMYKAQAERTKLAATDERIARNERLLRSMAARTAGAGARGVTLSTIAPSQAEDIRQTDMGQQAADATLAGNVSTLRARGSNAELAGRVAAGATLARALSSMARTG